jgi:tetratricopeptide (TPR) repeat protein
MISFIVISGGQRNKSVMRLIDSITSQKIDSYEIILVGRYDKEMPETCRLIKAGKLADEAEINKLRNIGLLNAKGDPAILLDDDVSLEKEWYEKIGDRLSGDYDIATCKVLTPSGERWYDWNQASRTDLSTPSRMLEYDERSEDLYISGCFMILRRRLFESIKFDEKLKNHQRDDVDFCHRAIDKGFNISIFREAQVVHHLDPAGRSEDDPALGGDDYGRGINLFRLGRYDEALSVFSAVTGDDKCRAIYHSALCLDKSGDKKRAIENLENVVKTGEGDTIFHTAHFHLGQLFEERGDKEKALSHYQHALEGMSEHHLAKEGVARLSGRTKS